MQKVLIADSSEAFVSALTQQLKPYFHICSCCDGREALEMLLSHKPDILVLDLTLPGLDGLSILQTAFLKGVRPAVLVTVSIMGYYVDSSLEQLGVAYVMRKPCDVKATALRILEIAGCPNAPVISEPDNRERAEGMLQVLGFPSEHDNYPCVLETILAYADNPDQSFTKDLYPFVAEKLGGSWKRVEKAIRDLMDIAWSNGSEQVWRAFFPAVFKKEPRRPTNSVFIKQLAKMLDNTSKTD